MITPGQFEVPGSTPITDPLQLQFMTQGQMGYMPQAQFLTPYQYGNFRTLPTPDVMGYAAQETGFIQNMLMANRGRDPFGILPAYTFNTYNPAVNARQQQVVAQRRMEDASALWAPLGLEMATNIGLTAFGGIPGMVASMIIPDWASPTEMVAQRRRSTREIQNLSTSKIFTGADRDQAYGLGFGYQQARGLDRFIRSSAADDSIMKEGDWRDILSLGMKYGQFDYANSAEQYKRILKNIRGNMTTMMEVIGSTDFEEIMKDMKRMQDMGARQEHYMNIARKEQQYARVTGLSHQEMVNTYGQAGALTFQQAGLNAMQGSVTAMGNAALATYLQRTGMVDPTLMAHFGGVSGMAQQMTQASATANRNIMDTLLAGMMNDDFTGLKEGFDLVSIANDPRGIDKLLARAGKADSIQKQRRFNVNRHKAMADLQEKYGPEVFEAILAKAAGQRLTGMEGDDALYYGYQSLGYSPEEAEARLAMVKSGGIWEMSKQAKEEQRRKAREEREQRNSPLAKIGRWFETMKENWGQRVYQAFDSATGGKNVAAEAAQNGQVVNSGIGTNGPQTGEEANPFRHTHDMPASLSSMSKEDQEAALYFINHKEEPFALTSYFETGKIGGTKGMSETGIDSDGGAVFGKYQTNAKQGSQQEWMQQLYTRKDANGNEVGKGIVSRILAAGGVTDLSDIVRATKSVNWKDKKVWEQYQKEVGENGEFMEKSQRDYIYSNVANAREFISHTKNGAEILKLVDSDPRLGALLYDTVVQHGATGAKNVFTDAFKSGINKRDFTSNVFLVSRPKFHVNGAKELEHRYRRQNQIYQAGFDADDGLISPSSGGDLSGLAAGDATIAQLTAASADTTARRGVDLKVRYGWGVKTGTSRAAQKGERTAPKKGKPNGDPLEEGVYYADCSGWAAEEMRDIGRTVNAASDYEVYDAKALQFFENARGMTADRQLGWFEDNDKLYKDSEVTEDFLKAQGVSLVGIDTGQYTSPEKFHEHKIDHVVMIYVDPQTGELMVAESQGGKDGGVKRTKYSEWLKTGSGAKARHTYAGSITHLAKTKDGKRNVGAAPSVPSAGGLAETAAGGTSRAAAEKDDAAATALLNDPKWSALDATFSSGWFGRTYGTVNSARGVLQDLSEAHKEDYGEREKRNLDYALSQINEERRAKGLNDVDFSKEDIETIIRNNKQMFSSSYNQFSGVGLDKYRDEKGNYDYSKMYKEHALFRMNVQLAEKLGYKGNDRYEFALNKTQDTRMGTMYREMFIAGKGYGAENFQSLEDDIYKQAQDALEVYNNVKTLGKKDALERTRKLLMGDKPEGFFSTGKFADEYEQFIGDQSKTKDKYGIETEYTRGEYVQQLPAVAGILGELENIENAQKTATNPEAKRMLAEQKTRAMNALYAILASYGLKPEEINKFVSQYESTDDRIRGLSTALGETRGGMELTEDQRILMTGWANSKKGETEDAYKGDFYESRTVTIGAGPFTWTTERESRKQFDERSKWLEGVPTNENLSTRLVAETASQYNLADQYSNAYMVLQKYGRADRDEIANFANKDKVSDARAKAILDSLRSYGYTKTADYLEGYRAQGVSVASGFLTEVMNEHRRMGNTEASVSPFVDEYSIDPRKAEGQEFLERGSGPNVPIGQLSQGANSALEQMPVVMSELTGAIKELNGILKILPRPGGAGGGG